MIELQSITKTFDGTRAVQSLDLTVDEGSVTVLIGPSGCGKSTTLRSIIGLIEPDRGTVIFEGRQIDTNDTKQLRELRHRIGYVIQGGGLFPHLTARRNISLIAEEMEWSPERIQKRLERLVDMTDFPSGGLERYPGQLSGGQKQRVSLMRALMLDPDVLLMDEPLGALDPMIRTDLREELDEIFDRLQKTVVMVTHDLDQAVYFADQIILMKDGEIVQRGSAQELLEQPTNSFVSDFVRAQRSEW